MAVFKVISVPQKYADEDAYADLIHYCIRPMKTPGNFIDGFGVLPQLAAEQKSCNCATKSCATCVECAGCGYFCEGCRSPFVD